MIAAIVRRHRIFLLQRRQVPRTYHHHRRSLAARSVLDRDYARVARRTHGLPAEKDDTRPDDQSSIDLARNRGRPRRGRGARRAGRSADRGAGSCGGGLGRRARSARRRRLRQHGREIRHHDRIRLRRQLEHEVQFAELSRAEFAEIGGQRRQRLISDFDRRPLSTMGVCATPLARV